MRGSFDDNELLHSIMKSRCRFCGLYFKFAMLGALALDAGGSTSLNPLHCYDEQERRRDHDFVNPEKNYARKKPIE
jgi:hypothetical protein